MHKKIEIFSSKPQQIAQAIIKVATQIFGKINLINFALVGDKKIVIDISENLKKTPFKNSLINNKSFLKFFDKKFNNILKKDEFLENFHQYDVFFVGFKSESKILSKEFIQQVLMRRKQKPLFLIEGGVPGNIDPAVSKLSNLFLYDLNDLEQIFSIYEKNKNHESVNNFFKDPQKDEQILNFFKVLNFTLKQKEIFYKNFNLFLNKNDDIDLKKKIFNFLKIFKE